MLGYLLGALEEDEQAAAERNLAKDAALRRELTVLSRSLAPLDASRARHEPPAGLAERTCRFVWASGQARAAAPVQPRREARPTRMRPVTLPAVGEVQYRWQDVLVVAGVIVAASVLLFPAIHGSRVQARLLACQNNLRELGAALTEYGELNHGYFPRVPAQGNLAVASVFAPILKDSQLLPSFQMLVCPDSPAAEGPAIDVPSLARLASIAQPDQLKRLQDQMGGSYGYTLGYRDRAGYHGTRNLRRSQFALASDAPAPGLPGRQSHNHGRHGQNCLMEDGHVRFFVTPRPATDDFFLNDDGAVAAGVHVNDSVIGAGATPPLP